MTRYPIFVDGAEGNNLGSPVQINRKGRIKAVQWNIVPALVYGESLNVLRLQISNAATYSAVTPQGTNSQEIASIDVGSWADDTATQAKAIAIGATMVVPCDFPVENGVQIFVNGLSTQGSNTQTAVGTAVLIVED